MRKTHLKIWNANLLITVGAIILTIFCVIMLIKPNRTYYFAGEMLFDNGTRQENIPIYTNIELPAGVYDVVLEYHADFSLNSWINAVDGTVFYGGLLTNGEPIYKNLTHYVDLWQCHYVVSRGMFCNVLENHPYVW